MYSKQLFKMSNFIESSITRSSESSDIVLGIVWFLFFLFIVFSANHLRPCRSCLPPALHSMILIFRAHPSHPSFFFLCSEHVKLLKPDGSEVFYQGGCNSSYPAGTSLEVTFGDAKYLILDTFLEYRWSVVNIEYSILSQGIDSGLQSIAYHARVNA